jgi:hypothetical protein
VAGYVVGVEGLGLECKKDRDPLIPAGERKEETAVLPHAVVSDKAAHFLPVR